MSFTNRTRLLLCGAGLLAFTNQAFALDGADLVAKINAAQAVSGSFSITTDGVDVNGSTVTLKHVMALPSSNAAKPLAVGDVKLTDVAETADGGYTIGKVAFPDINASGDGTTLTVKDMNLTGISVPGHPQPGNLDGFLMWQTAHSGPAHLVRGNTEIASFKSIDLNLNKRPENAGFDFNGAIKTIRVDLSQAQDPKTLDLLRSLQMQHVAGDFTMSGSWTLSTGALALEDTLDLENIGRLDVSLGISGYSMAFIKATQDALSAAKANPNKQQAQQALNLAMLGLIQQLTLDKANIRFDDHSITRRVLTYFAGQQSVPVTQFTNSLKAITPILLSQLNIPELQNALSAAVSTYLDDPKNFVVTAAPDKPVAFPIIMGAAMGAPNTLPKVLGLKVEANTP